MYPKPQTLTCTSFMTGHGPHGPIETAYWQHFSLKSKPQALL